MTDPAPSNYVARAAAAFDAAFAATGYSCSPALRGLYVLLVLTRGEHCTTADVHDAWAVDTAATRGEHPYLVPSAELTPEVQELDIPVCDAIRAAARSMSAAMPAKGEAASRDVATIREALGRYYRHGITQDAVDEEYDARAVLAALRGATPAPAVADGGER